MASLENASPRPLPALPIELVSLIIDFTIAGLDLYPTVIRTWLATASLVSPSWRPLCQQRLWERYSRVASIEDAKSWLMGKGRYKVKTMELLLESASREEERCVERVVDACCDVEELSLSGAGLGGTLQLVMVSKMTGKVLLSSPFFATLTSDCPSPFAGLETLTMVPSLSPATHYTYLPSTSNLPSKYTVKHLNHFILRTSSIHEEMMLNLISLFASTQSVSRLTIDMPSAEGDLINTRLILRQLLRTCTTLVVNCHRSLQREELLNHALWHRVQHFTDTITSDLSCSYSNAFLWLINRPDSPLETYTILCNQGIHSHGAVNEAKRTVRIITDELVLRHAEKKKTSLKTIVVPLKVYQTIVMQEQYWTVLARLRGVGVEVKVGRGL